MQVAYILTQDVVTIRNPATVAAAVKLIRRNKIQALIVERNHEEDAYGIVTVTDIVAKVIALPGRSSMPSKPSWLINRLNPWKKPLLKPTWMTTRRLLRVGNTTPGAAGKRRHILCQYIGKEPH